MWLWFSFPLIFLCMKHELGVQAGGRHWKGSKILFQEQVQDMVLHGRNASTPCRDEVLFIPEDWQVQNSIPARMVSWHDPLQQMLHQPILLGMLAWPSWPWRAWMGQLWVAPILEIKRWLHYVPRISRSRKFQQRANYLPNCFLMVHNDRDCIFLYFLFSIVQKIYSLNGLFKAYIT